MKVERDLPPGAVEKARQIAARLVEEHSQSWLAKELDANQSGISKLLSETQGISLFRAVQLCALANVPVSEVLGEELASRFAELLHSAGSIERESDATAQGIVAGLIAAKQLDPSFASVLLPRVKLHLGHFSNGRATPEQRMEAGAKALDDLEGFVTPKPPGLPMLPASRAPLAERAISVRKRKR